MSLDRFYVLASLDGKKSYPVGPFHFDTQRQSWMDEVKREAIDLGVGMKLEMIPAESEEVLAGAIRPPAPEAFLMTFVNLP